MIIVPAHKQTDPSKLPGQRPKRTQAAATVPFSPCANFDMMDDMADHARQQYLQERRALSAAIDNCTAEEKT